MPEPEGAAGGGEDQGLTAQRSPLDWPPSDCSPLDWPPRGLTALGLLILGQTAARTGRPWTGRLEQVEALNEHDLPQDKEPSS